MEPTVRFEDFDLVCCVQNGAGRSCLRGWALRVGNLVFPSEEAKDVGCYDPDSHLVSDRQIGSR